MESLYFAQHGILIHFQFKSFFHFSMENGQNIHHFLHGFLRKSEEKKIKNYTTITKIWSLTQITSVNC